MFLRPSRMLLAVFAMLACTPSRSVQTLRLLPSKENPGDAIASSVDRLPKLHQTRCPVGSLTNVGPEQAPAFDAQTLISPPAGLRLGTDKVPGNPIHEVTLAPFCIDVFEVTLARYCRCVLAGRCRAINELSLDCVYISRRCEPSDSTKACNIGEPVRYLTPQDATDVCRFEDKRLPTSEEWETASMGPTFNIISVLGREGVPDEVVDYTMSHCRPHTFVGVSSSDTNGQIFDMAGNVSEWTATGEGGIHVARGGSCTWKSLVFASAFRWLDDAAHVEDVGVRCASDPRGEP
jgi:formylglycine-generating enzyme required for sulfatase activity